MGMIKEFKEFAMQGNVIDLAIGVVIGTAFGKIVGSLIDDVITPLLLKPALDAANLADIKDLKWGAVTYGNFLSAVISFIMIALVLFMVIKGMNSAKKKEATAPAAPAAPSTEEKLLTEIRDLLRK
jgi:large conductance mechanosensitive channel